MENSVIILIWVISFYLIERLLMGNGEHGKHMPLTYLFKLVYNDMRYTLNRPLGIIITILAMVLAPLTLLALYGIAIASMSISKQNPTLKDI